MASLDHARVGDDIFFKNDYLSLALNTEGSLGSSVAPPAGFPNDPAFTDLALFGGGIYPGSSDAVLPGFPIDGFTVAHDAHNYTNDALAGEFGIATLAGSIKDKSTATQDKALWSGKTADGLKVDQTVTLDPSAHYITVKVTLTNTTGAAMSDVRYLKSMDPDQGFAPTGESSTSNLLFAQTAKAHGIAAFIDDGATGVYGAAPVFLYSKDPRADASFGPGLEQKDAYDSSLYGQPQGDVSISDDGINLAFKLGTLGAGAHTTLTYYYGMTDALEETIANLGSKPVDLTSGNDKKDYSAAAAKVFVDAGAGADSIVGSGFSDIINGGLNADTLLGGAGKDSMDGGQGGDVLTGGAGGDLLFGGVGADRFVYLSLSDSTVSSGGRDSIMDFNHPDGDKIDLSAIDANTTVAGNQAFTLGGDSFTHVAGQLIVVAPEGMVGFIVEGDVDGDAAADFAIYVRGLWGVSSDFVL
jgi:Ca2+-binding RTX toxin-like protein